MNKTKEADEINKIVTENKYPYFDTQAKFCEWLYDNFFENKEWGLSYCEFVERYGNAIATVYKKLVFNIKD